MDFAELEYWTGAVDKYHRALGERGGGGNER
jgi:hypothetical protein